MPQDPYRNLLCWVIALFGLAMVSCQSEKNTQRDEEAHKEFLRHALQRCDKNKHPIGDRVLSSFYKKNGRMVWIDDFTDTVAVQTFLEVLSQVHVHGLEPQQFLYEELKREYESLRFLAMDSLKKMPERVAGLDYRFTESYFFYVRGVHFGFLHPGKLFNNLEKSGPRYIGDSSERMKMLYDRQVKTCDSLFFHHALEQVGKGLESFLTDLQPQNPLYAKLMEDRPASEKDRKARIANLEMQRWKSVEAPAKGRRIFINLASQQLTALDEKDEPVVEMKICTGSLRHKTPVLDSRIDRLEVNPYWNVPASIVRWEIIPAYRKDSAYFTRQRMKVFDRQRNRISPHEAEWDPAAEKIPYTVRQDNGPRNSLGQIIFRFRNQFEVYLHDTNNRAAFQQKNRAISHGCIRLEKPLELLAFLEPDPRRYQRILKAIQPDEEGLFHLMNFSLDVPVPLEISYQTATLDEEKRPLYHPDPYGYDVVMCNQLKTVNSD